MSNSGSGSTSSAGEISGLSDIAQGQVQLANQVQNLGQGVYSQGQDIYNPAYQQYVSGISGQLTPAQQALVDQNLATSNTGTMGTYGNLGLGGSTMEGQDLGNNQLKSLAEQSNINFGNETLGLEGLKTADQYYSTADQFYNTGANALSGAATSTYDAGNLANANASSLNSAISSLGGKASSDLSSLFSGAGGAGLASLFGSSGGSAAAGSGIADAATGLIAFA